MTRREFWNGRRILITGHTGFKGCWLALWLASLGARVSGFALQPATQPSLWELVEGQIEIDSTIADVRDVDHLNTALQKTCPEIVFHLAAQSLVRASYEDPVLTYATNVMGTVNLLEAVRRTPGVRAVVNVTSDKCYENRDLERGYREDDAMGGRDPYSSSKGCAELVTAAFRASYFDISRGDAAIASARAGNVIGGGDWAADRIVPDIVRAVLRGELVSIRSPGAIRPWQHVLEPLAGYMKLAEQLFEAPEGFAEGWNFGPSEHDAASVETVANTILRDWGAETGWEKAPGPHSHEARTLLLDSSKARSRLGWQPRLNLATALEWTVEWYKAQANGGDAKGLSLAQINRYMQMGGS